MIGSQSARSTFRGFAYLSQSCAPRRRHHVFSRDTDPRRRPAPSHETGPTRSRSRVSRKARNLTSTEKAVLHGEVKPVLHASAIALQAEFRPMETIDTTDQRFPDKPFCGLDLGWRVRKTVDLAWRWCLAAGWHP